MQARRCVPTPEKQKECDISLLLILSDMMFPKVTIILITHSTCSLSARDVQVFEAAHMFWTGTDLFICGQKCFDQMFVS